MALNYVTLTCDLFDGSGNVITSGTASFTPSVQLTDTTDHELIIQAPVTVAFRPSGSPAVSLLATDNTAPAPSGWVWMATFSGVAGNPAGFSFFLPFSSGASQYLSSQAPVSSAVAMAGYLPLAGGTMTGRLAISPPGTPAVSQLDVEGSTSGAGQLAFIKNTSAANGDHALTAEQAASGFDNTVAGNFTSLSTLSSTVYISGQATQRGVLKISHQGHADGSDSAASAVSIDLQTTIGGSAGTAAQGIFITSTTDAAPGGNALTVRYNSLDQFVLKSSGLVGIGVAIGHTPAGMVEIAQKDTSTVGLFMQAISSGTDLVSLKDSGGNQRFQVNNSGNTIMRASAFFTTNAIIGSASGDFGGGSAGLTICHATDPTTNPASGHIILYCDSSGNLLARTSAGNVRTVAAV